MRFDPSTTARWVLLTLAALAAFFLVTEHRADAFGGFHFLLLTACMLLLYLLIRHEENRSSTHTPPSDAIDLDPQQTGKGNQPAQPERTSDETAPRQEDR
jgi:hypothetical protein